MRSRIKTNTAGLAPLIGKSVALHTCTKNTTYNSLLKPKEPIVIPKPYLDLPEFDQSLKSVLNYSQKSILTYFENYPYLKQHENYIYNENTPYSCINLEQRDFNNGTVRITVPGIYILKENIEFNPNPNDDFMPRASQISQYPMGSSGAYHLGFFAAITIECDNVLLDLNGKMIIQSKMHNLQQRFYAHIELASAPFIPSQGPGNFGSSVAYPENVLITNGTLALSSHHGIHGNKMEKVFLHKLTIFDFEVAAIALNGTNNSVFDDIKILGTFTNTQVLSTYSSGRFIRRFLDNIKSVDVTRHLALNSGTKLIGTIINELNSELENTRLAVENNSSLPNNIFKNSTGLYDGNVYGIVLNRHGVVVNDFITTLGSVATGNRHVYLRNIKITDIASHPVEIVGISCPDPSTGAYGKGVQVGPAGDVFQATFSSNTNGTYKQNVLANSKIIIGKYNSPKQGTACMSSEVISWAENGTTDISGVIHSAGRYFTSGEDSMAHKMKGNIGLFISSGENIKMDNVTINGVHNMGTNIGNDRLLSNINKNGAISFGIVVTGSNLIKIKNTNINNITSENGDVNGIMLKSSTNITNLNISINNLNTTDSSSSTNLILQN